jgi:hypothetical protein
MSARADDMIPSAVRTQSGDAKNTEEPFHPSIQVASYRVAYLEQV